MSKIELDAKYFDTMTLEIVKIIEKPNLAGCVTYEFLSGKGKYIKFKEKLANFKAKFKPLPLKGDKYIHNDTRKMVEVYSGQYGDSNAFVRFKKVGKKRVLINSLKTFKKAYSRYVAPAPVVPISLPIPLKGQNYINNVTNEKIVITDMYVHTHIVSFKKIGLRQEYTMSLDSFHKQYSMYIPVPAVPNINPKTKFININTKDIVVINRVDNKANKVFFSKESMGNGEFDMMIDDFSKWYRMYIPAVENPITLKGQVYVNNLTDEKVLITDVDFPLDVITYTRVDNIHKFKMSVKAFHKHYLLYSPPSAVKPAPASGLFPLVGPSEFPLKPAPASVVPEGLFPWINPSEFPLKPGRIEPAIENPFNRENVMSYNVGDSDYSKNKIQPWDVWEEYFLNPWDADIVKRTLRTKETQSRREDYEKIKHICDKRISQIDAGIKVYGEDMLKTPIICDQCCTAMPETNKFCPECGVKVK